MATIKTILDTIRAKSDGTFNVIFRITHLKKVYTINIYLVDNDRLIELLFCWKDVVKDSEEEAIRLRSNQINSIQLGEKYIRSFDVWIQNNLD